MMLQCCGQVAPIVPILTNPLTWLLALAAVSTVVSKATGSKKK